MRKVSGIVIGLDEGNNTLVIHHVSDIEVAALDVLDALVELRVVVERLPSTKHEVWILGPQTPVGGRRATRVDVPAA